jgi:hypothetical protein
MPASLGTSAFMANKLIGSLAGTTKLKVDEESHNRAICFRRLLRLRLYQMGLCLGESVV